ncbi:STAS domain-containing protein [Azohydromonas sp. G-1-1-14]|uniref:STAS domain-containing protein n=1 Tax=Azohydromonas caseinilytica TaxID=2728836 RepID=A0A848F5Q9_9BURK|nr:STAS domain-containing protein [Azohydromonas caseinilytica]
MTLPYTLTLATAVQTLRTLEPTLTGSARMELDASALRDFDSAALAVMLQLRRSAQAAGGDLRITGAPRPLVELAQLYGVDEALPGLEEALPVAANAA